MIDSFGAATLSVMLMSIQFAFFSSRTQSNAEYHLGTVLVCLILASLWGVFIVYEYLPHRRDLDRQASEFTFADAECLVTRDKVQLHRIIKHWYGSLEAFEKYVRDRKAYVIDRKRPWTISSSTLTIISLPIELTCVGRLVAYYGTARPLDMEGWMILRSFASALVLLLCRLPLLVFVAHVFLEDKSVSKWVEALAVALLSVVYELITLIIGGDLTFAQLNVLPEPLDTASVIIPLVALFLTCKIYRNDPNVRPGQV